MKRLLFLVLVLCLCVAPVLGVRENFQDFTLGGLSYDDSYTHLNTYFTFLPAASNGTVGIYLPRSNVGAEMALYNTAPVAMTYSAIDFKYNAFTDDQNIKVELWDANKHLMDDRSIGGCFGTRIEMKMIGGTPTIFCNGVQTYTMAVQSINPSYVSWAGYDYYGLHVDNAVYGETDHHILGALPTNWTIRRDLLNPASTGVYAWSGSSWVLENSHNFYIDADKEFLNTENVVIKDAATQTTINSTPVIGEMNTIQYNLTQFLTTPSALGTSLPDGMYTVSFDTSPAIYDSFWVISSGATMSWDHTVYSQGSNGVVTYAIAGSGYWDQSTYSYSMVTKSIYGTVMNTQTIPTQTGTISVPITTSYGPGVYYAEIDATKISDGTVNVMNVAYMSVTTYIPMNGFVMNEETGATIAAANLNVTQGLQTQTVTSGYDGNWSSSNGWVSGSAIAINTTASGFKQNTHIFTPLSSSSVFLNISMSPINSTHSGVSIGGVVSDNQYGNPIPGAIYHTLNSTELTATTNIAGFARVDGLINGKLYSVWSSKTGYGNSSVTQIVAVGT